MMNEERRKKLQSFMEYLEVHSLKIYFPHQCKQARQVKRAKGDIDDDDDDEGKMYQFQFHMHTYVCVTHI